MKFSDIIFEVVTDKKMKVIKTWGQRMVNNGANPDEIKFIITHFFDYQPKLENKDILTYGSGEVNHLFHLLKRMFEARTKKNIKINETDRVFEDDKWLIIHPKTHESLCYYASGARWCTTMRNFYDNYRRNGDFLEFILINKEEKELECNRKLNVGVYKKHGISDIFDACDKAILFFDFNDNKKCWNRTNPIPEYIMNVIEDYSSNKFNSENLTLEQVDSLQKNYLKWKRKNVTIRGIKEFGKENGGMGSFGGGLYTAFLGNREMAKIYGKVYFLLNAKPKHPKVVNTLNDAEIFIQGLINKWCKERGMDYNSNYFYEKTNISTEMIKSGFDGLVIRGREIVNYSPNIDEIKYFETEDELRRYYLNNIESQHHIPEA